VTAALPVEDQEAEESQIESKAEVQKRGIDHSIGYGGSGFEGKYLLNKIQSRW